MYSKLPPHTPKFEITLRFFAAHEPTYVTHLERISREGSQRGVLNKFVITKFIEKRAVSDFRSEK